MSIFKEQEFRNLANQKDGPRGLSGTVNENIWRLLNLITE
jgi:hypothetical protein